MAGDLVLWRDGPVSVPLSYKVPQGGELLPLTVEATVDGSTAASEFYAVLQVLDPSGRSMGKYITTAIAAGGSADVTWFPGAEPLEDTQLADYNATVLNLGPWGYWKLNEPNGSTSAADASGHGRTLSTIDGGSTNSFGATGLLTTSPQTCDQITYNAASNVYPLDSPATQTFTPAAVSIEAWIQTSGGTGHDQTIIGLGRFDTEGTWWALLNSSGQPQFTFIDSGSVQRSVVWAVGLADGLTHHLVIVQSGSTATAYVDGVLVSAQPTTGGLKVPATHTVYLGGIAGGAVGRVFQGKIGPVVVYDKALTAAQVATLFNQGDIDSGGVNSVVAADTSIVAGGTATDVTLATGTLDVIATQHPPAANWSNNSKKITGLTEGAASGEAATYAATPAGIVTAKGDLLVGSGSHAAARLGVGSDTNVLIADSTQTNGVKWGTISAAAGVASIDSITGAVTLVAGSNIAISDNNPSAGSITLTATGSGVANELDYVEKTSSVTITASTDATATTVLDGNAVTYSGSTRVKIEFWCIAVTNPSNQETIFVLYDGSTDLGRYGAASNAAGSQADAGPMYCVRFLTPSAASHTFHVKAFKVVGAGGSPIVSGGAGGAGVAFPMWYRITTA